MISFSARFPLCWVLCYFYCSVCRVSALYMKIDFWNTKNHRAGREVIYCVPQPKGRKEGRIILMPFLTPCNGDCTISLVNLFQCFISWERERVLFPASSLRLPCSNFNPLLLIISTMRKQVIPLVCEADFCVLVHITNSRLLPHPLQVPFRISNPNLFHLLLSITRF